MQDHFDQPGWSRERWAYYNMGSPCFMTPERRGDSLLVLPESDRFNEGNCLLSRDFCGPAASISATVTQVEAPEIGGAGIGFYAGRGQFTDYVLLAATASGLELRVPSGAQRGASFMDAGQPQWYVVERCDWQAAYPCTLKLARNGEEYRAYLNGREVLRAIIPTLKGDARALIKALPWNERYQPTHTTFDWAQVEGLLPGNCLRGRVTGPQGGGIPGASVHIAGFDHLFALCDEAGGYVLTGVPRGEHVLVAAAEGYAFATVPAQVVPGGQKPLDVTLAAETPETLPRREYNNPAFDRSHHGFLCLNGTWQFCFDPENVGESRQWYEPEGHRYDRAIRVPFSWASLMGFGEEHLAQGATTHESNTAMNNYHLTGSHGWYKRAFTVPDSFPQGQHTVLHIGAAANVTNVWLDGCYQGMREDEYGDLEFDLGMLAPGSGHTLVVKVEYPHHIHAHNMGKQIFWFSSAPGIWQSVWIEPRRETFIKELRLRPLLDFQGEECVGARAVVYARVQGQEGTELCVSLRAPDGSPACEAAFPVRAGEAQGEIEIPDPVLWQYRQGNLYSVRAVLRQDGQEVDSVGSTLGLRQVETCWLPGHSPQDTDDPLQQYQYVFLNNRPFYIMGILDQCYNAFGIYTYRSLQAEGPQGARGSIAYDIDRTIAYGYNLSRVHIKENEPLWYHECDKQGLPVWTEHPGNFYATPDDPLWQAAYLREMRGMLRRLHNHPSIVIVSSINESWGIEGRHVSTPWKNQLRADFMRDIAQQTKAGWPHVLVCDNSGFGKTSACEINDFHYYPSDHDEARERWVSLMRECYPGSIYNYINAGHGPHHIGDAVQSGRPILISEFLHINGIDMQLRMFEKVAGYLRMNVASHEVENSGPLTADRYQRDYGYVDRHLEPLGYDMVNNMDMMVLDANRLQQVRAGEIFCCDVYTSHFAWREVRDARLCWSVTGINAAGEMLPGVEAGAAPIDFAPFRVEKQAPLTWRIPKGLCGAYVFAWVEAQGETLCQNYIQLEILGTERQESKAIRRLCPTDVQRVRFEGFYGLYQEEGRALFWGASAGEVSYALTLDQDAPAGELVFEAGARRGPAAVQVTDEIPYPTEIDVYLDEYHLGRVNPQGDFSDERGLFTNSALGGQPFSYRNLGRYGYGQRFRLSLPGAALAKGMHTLRFVCAEGGLTLYGERMGRYGAPPTLYLQER